MKKDMVALVTGGSRGIGRAVCVELSKQVTKIAVVYSGNQDAAEETKKLVEETGAECRIYQCNVADFTQTAELVKKVSEELGTVDILVNNAGITKDKLMLSMKEDEFDSVIDVNLKGAFNLIRHTASGMIKKRYGKIINITSIAGLIGNPGQANYAASKAGLIGLTKTVAKELASRNVCCNAVAPGFVDTDMTEKFKTDEKILATIPQKRVGKPEEVAKLVAFLASDVADYITGETIRIDGGLAI